MKITKITAILTACVLVLTGCATPGTEQTSATRLPAETYPAPTAPACPEATQILLSDSGITADGAAVTGDSAASLYTANDIVYYEAGKDFTYGEGEQKDAHSAEEAAAHTVLHIQKAGAYRISGKLSLGQIAVDLGEEAKSDPQAVVTLILDGVDITCQVAPAVIFYNVYECGSDDAEAAVKDVDTSAAGANVILADGSVNQVTGAYVAKIYAPDTVVLNGDKTAVEDAKKLHKYDGAFYSRRSMNLYGEQENTGVLNIRAANEGLDSELHLTVNGGNINIVSGNDGINTNEDNVSVTTINGGNLTIRVSGETGEGDGIDSNGWLVINGGNVTASACGTSADAGIDSDKGIHINGGRVLATGSMLDRIEAGGQTYAVFSFATRQKGGETVKLVDPEGKTLLEAAPENAYTTLIYSSPLLTEGSYTLWSNDRQMAGRGGGNLGFGGMGGGMGQRPEGAERPEGQEPPEGMQPPEGQEPPEGMQRPEGQEPPEGQERPERPEGGPWGNPGEGFGGGKGNGWGTADLETSPEFPIVAGGNQFGGIAPYTE